MNWFRRSPFPPVTNIQLGITLSSSSARGSCYNMLGRSSCRCEHDSSKALCQACVLSNLLCHPTASLAAVGAFVDAQKRLESLERLAKLSYYQSGMYHDALSLSASAGCSFMNYPTCLSCSSCKSYAFFSPSNPSFCKYSVIILTASSTLVFSL